MLEVRVTIPFVVAALVVSSGLAGAHLFNHQTRHEDCQSDLDPHHHGTGDGHKHTHDVAAATAQNLHNHDPCKQIGMRFPTFAAAGPIQEITVEEAAVPDNDPTNTEVIVGDEAFRLPVPSLAVQTNLLANKDATLSGMGFPGSGTPADPYIIEGYYVKNVLQLKDTAACVVVRNNVVHSDAIEGPIVDLLKIVDLQKLRDEAEALHQAAEDLARDYAAQAEGWAAQAADWQARLDGLEAQAAGWEAQAADWNDAESAFARDYADFERRVGELADAYEAFALQYQQEPAPQKAYQTTQVMEERVPLFETYLGALDSYTVSTPPPAEPPAGWEGDWAAARAEHEAYLDSVQEDLMLYELDLMSREPDPEARASFDAAYVEFQAAYAAVLAQFDTFSAQRGAFEDAREAALAEAWHNYDAAAALVDGTGDFLFSYAGFLYDTLEELIRHLLDQLREALDPVHTGRLVLDWNGQCLHAYNNVVEDLRVNQNNDRTGYATGGLVEQNRFYDIGQIRHYDGEFRRNEVGDRDHLRSLLDPTVAAPAADRSINNDGANQGWLHHNLIYGQVDLDFHGHHHGAGFFAPESHYHGSDQGVAYMKNPDGTFMLDAGGQKIPHMDHAKRWTSVLFEDNVVIDPLGVGLRFEDLNHRGDDARANSENMAELDRPHFHRTWVRLLDNVVVGRLSVEVLNAAGTDLWSDTWSEVKAGLVEGTLDAAQHLGADIVNSHPQRNNAWLDVQGNSVVLVGGGAAYRVTQAKEMDLFQFKANRGYLLGSGADSGLDEDGFVAFLRGLPSATPSSANSRISGWGGATGPATGIVLEFIRDSAIQVCNNAILGFSKGLQATTGFYDTTSISTCPQNDWGKADPRIEIQFTPTPGAGSRVSQPLRDVTDTTPAKPLLRPTYDEADKQGKALGL